MLNISPMRYDGLTDDEGYFGIPSHDDADTAEVSSTVLVRGDVGRGDAVEDRPAYDTDDEDDCDGESAGLTPVGEGREEEHEDQRGGVGRDGEKLGSGVVAGAEAADDCREEVAYGSEA